MLPQLSDAQLCGLMHSRSESGAGVYVQHRPVLVLRLNILPGRDHQNIVYIKLMKILLPVIDPVQIFRLLHCDRAFTNLAEPAQLLQFPLYILQNRCFIGLFPQNLQTAILLLLHKKAQISNAVVFLALRKNIHEHLLLLQGSQGNLVLDLSPFQAYVVQRTDDNVFGVRYCFYFEFFPFHWQFPPLLSSILLPAVPVSRLSSAVPSDIFLPFAFRLPSHFHATDSSLFFRLSASHIPMTRNKSGAFNTCWKLTIEWRPYITSASNPVPPMQSHIKLPCRPCLSVSSRLLFPPLLPYLYIPARKIAR